MGGMLRNGPDGLRAGRDLFEDFKLMLCHSSSEHRPIFQISHGKWSYQKVRSSLDF